MEQYHPIINFIYFCMVLGCSMFFMHPVCLGISLVSAFFYALHLFGWADMRKGLAGIGFLMGMTAVMNPAFSHQGVTVLTYLPTGNVLTLESVLYGIAAACMLAAVLLWFRCMNKIMTADKIVYLFGKSFPVLGLILSMVMGFLPKMQKKLREISLARREIQEESFQTEEKKCTKRQKNIKKQKSISFRIKGKIRHIRHGIENLSILITWSLEDAVEMADSMKSRGYGLEGRTSFTTCRFTKRDGKMLFILLFETGYMILGGWMGGIAWNYYPETGGAGFELYSVSIYLVYLFMCLTPLIIDGYEERKWNKLQSAI